MRYLIVFFAVGLAAAQGPFDAPEDGFPEDQQAFPGPAGGFGRFGGKGKGGKGRGHHHRFEPPFLKGQNETVKREFFQIVRKSNETIQEQKEEINSWASKWNLLDQVNAFQANITQFKQQLSKNISDLVATLPQVQQSLEKILNDETQTRQQMWEAVRQLKNQSRQAVDSLFFIGSTFRHHRRPQGMVPLGMDRPNNGQGGPLMGRMGGVGGMRGGQRGQQNPFERNSIQRGF